MWKTKCKGRPWEGELREKAGKRVTSGISNISHLGDFGNVDVAVIFYFHKTCGVGDGKWGLMLKIFLFYFIILCIIYFYLNENYDCDIDDYSIKCTLGVILLNGRIIRHY